MGKVADKDFFFDFGGLRRQNKDAFGEIDCFFKVMGNENDSLLFAFPQFDQRVFDMEAGLGV